MKGNLVITVPAESHNEWHSDLERGGATLQSLRAAAAGTVCLGPLCAFDSTHFSACCVSGGMERGQLCSSTGS